jgi:hypothetical protein
VLYRVLRDLSVGDEVYAAGSVYTLATIKESSITVLLHRGAIRQVIAPPLAQLPGWTTRAKRLDEKLGLKNVYDLLDTDPKAIATVMRVTPETVEKWQVEAFQSMTEPTPKKRGG